MKSYLDDLQGVSQQTLVLIRSRVEQLMNEGACKNQYPKGLSEEQQRGARWMCCLEKTLEENWDELSEDEKVRIRFPGAKAIGEKVEIPNRGVCEIVRYELTKRFGLRVT